MPNHCCTIIENRVQNFIGGEEGERQCAKGNIWFVFLEYYDISSNKSTMLLHILISHCRESLGFKKVYVEP